MGGSLRGPRGAAGRGADGVSVTTRWPSAPGASVRWSRCRPGWPPPWGARCGSAWPGAAGSTASSSTSARTGCWCAPPPTPARCSWPSAPWSPCGPWARTRARSAAPAASGSATPCARSRATGPRWPCHWPGEGRRCWAPSTPWAPTTSTSPSTRRMLPRRRENVTSVATVPFAGAGGRGVTPLNPRDGGRRRAHAGQPSVPGSSGSEAGSDRVVTRSRVSAYIRWM